jgi:hypothetical protein
MRMPRTVFAKSKSALRARRYICHMRVARDFISGIYFVACVEESVGSVFMCRLSIKISISSRHVVREFFSHGRYIWNIVD